MCHSNPLRFVERPSPEFGFMETGSQEFSTLNICRVVLWWHVPPCFAIQVLNKLRVECDALLHLGHTSSALTATAKGTPIAPKCFSPQRTLSPSLVRSFT